MGPTDLLIHLLNFAAPAFVVALLVASAARVLLSGQSLGGSWWASIAINFIAGLAVCGAGLWHFGVDGKMATYAALVVVVATSQWLLARGWRN
jgi:hypothetical protein